MSLQVELSTLFLVLRPMPSFGESETQSKKGSEKEDIDFVDLQCVPKLIRHRTLAWGQNWWDPGSANHSIPQWWRLAMMLKPRSPMCSYRLLNKQLVVCCCFGLYEQDTYREMFKSMPD